MDDIQSNCISWTKLCLSILVVFIHIPPPDVGRIDFLLYTLFSQGICRIAVPAFFIISGYLFITGLEKQWNWEIWRKKIKKRLKTVLFPYFLCNALFIVLLNIPRLLYSLYSSNSFDFCWLDSWLAKNDGILGIFFGWGRNGFVPLNYPLWFLLDLMVMFFLSPIIVFILKKSEGLVLLFAVIPLLFNIRIPLPGFSTEAFFFFSLGLYSRMKEKTLFAPPSRNFRHMFVLFFILLMLQMYYYKENESVSLFIRHLIELIGTPLSFPIFYLMFSQYKNRYSDFLCSSGFFIYLSHIPLKSTYFFSVLIYPPLHKMLSNIFPLSDFLLYLITIFLVVIFSLFSYFLLYKYMPSIRRLLYGGR